MNYQALNKQISDVLQSQGDLSPLREAWLNKIQWLHDFLDMFLDRFSERVIGDRDNSPEWELYSAKTEEYNNYSRALRNLEYFMAKERLANG